MKGLGLRLLLLLVIPIVSACSGASSSSFPPLPACNGNTFFSVSPLAMTDFTGLVPLGNLNPSGHTFPTDHIYFYIKTSGGAAPDVVPVVAPGDGWITAISSSENLSANTPYTDYSLQLQPCDKYILSFGHVETLSDPVKALIASAKNPYCQTYTAGGSTSKNCLYFLQSPIKAGDALGTAGGTPGQNALDMGAYDLRQTPLAFIDLTRLEAVNAHLPYAVCPVDAFDDSVKSALSNRFSDSGGTRLRTVEPKCGTVMQDVPDTAQGLWILESANSFNPEDPNLALVHDNVDPTTGVISMGTSIPALTGRHFITPTSSGLINRDFDQVTADGTIYCYTSSWASGAILITMPSPTKLLVEYQPSTSCADGHYTMTENAVSFIR